MRTILARPIRLRYAPAVVAGTASLPGVQPSIRELHCLLALLRYRLPPTHQRCYRCALAPALPPPLPIWSVCSSCPYQRYLATETSSLGRHLFASHHLVFAHRPLARTTKQWRCEFTRHQRGFRCWPLLRSLELWPHAYPQRVQPHPARPPSPPQHYGCAGCTPPHRRSRRPVSHPRRACSP